MPRWLMILARTEAEGVAPADCAEEECDADEVVEQAGLFASYMASRLVCLRCCCLDRCYSSM